MNFTDAEKNILNTLLNSEPIEFVDNEEFYKRNAKNNIFKDRICMDHLTPLWGTFMSQPFSIGTVKKVRYKSITFAGKQEYTAFLQFNYARFCVNKKQKLNRKLSLREKKDILYWNNEQIRLKHSIAMANIGLVFNLAKKISAKFTDIDNFEISSCSMVPLLRCIDKFDISRGFKFSTYCWNAILKEVGRAIAKHNKYNSFHKSFVSIDAYEKNDIYDENYSVMSQTENKTRELEISELRKILFKCMEVLNDDEKLIIQERYPMCVYQEKGTLEYIGKTLDVSKERVRQKQNTALEKLYNEIMDRKLIPSF